MPKNKTHKGTAKRIRVTGTGKLVREHTHNQHKFEVKTSSRKHRLDRDADVHKTDEKKIKRLLAER